MASTVRNTASTDIPRVNIEYAKRAYPPANPNELVYTTQALQGCADDDITKLSTTSGESGGESQLNSPDIRLLAPERTMVPIHAHPLADRCTNTNVSSHPSSAMKSIVAPAPHTHERETSGTRTSSAAAPPIPRTPPLEAPRPHTARTHNHGNATHRTAITERYYNNVRASTGNVGGVLEAERAAAKEGKPQQRPSAARSELPPEVLEGRAVGAERLVADLTTEREFLLQQLYAKFYPERGGQSVSMPREAVAETCTDTPSGAKKSPGRDRSNSSPPHPGGHKDASMEERVHAEKLLYLQAFQDILQNVIHTLLGDDVDADDVMTAPSLHNLSRDLWALGQANFETQRQLAMNFQVAQDEFVKQVERGLMDTFGDRWDSASPAPTPRAAQAVLPPQIDAGMPPLRETADSPQVDIQVPNTARTQGSRRGGSNGMPVPPRAMRAMTPRGISLFSPRADASMLRALDRGASPVDGQPRPVCVSSSPAVHAADGEHMQPPQPSQSHSPQLTEDEDAIARLSRVVDQQARLVVREVQEHFSTRAALRTATAAEEALRAENAELLGRLKEKEVVIDDYVRRMRGTPQAEPVETRRGDFNFECRCSLAPVFSWMWWRR